MISQFIPVEKSNRLGVAIAVFLFILQFIYFQMQGSALNWIKAYLLMDAMINGWLPINNPENLLMLLHIFVHAAFSVLIIHFLYRDRQSTWLVVYLSIFLLAAYVATNLIGKIMDFFIINIISTKIYLFIASPFKTIFSIPSLKLRNDEQMKA